MTALPDTDLPAGDEASLPEFATVMRGYDRGQVDDYVRRLLEFLADAEQRADRAVASVTARDEQVQRLRDELAEARAERAGSAYEGLGERIESMLRLAAEEAEALRSGGRADAEAAVAHAEEEAARINEQAERDLAAVAARRDGVVGELRRVQEVLATLGLRSAPEPADVASGDDVIGDAADPAATTVLRPLPDTGS